MSEGAAKKEERRKFQAIKGTRDLLPPETPLWHHVEQTAQEVFTSYGFGEIRLPIFEQTGLFARAVGGETDIVSKEMYKTANQLDALRQQALGEASFPFVNRDASQLIRSLLAFDIFASEAKRAIEAKELESTTESVSAIRTIEGLLEPARARWATEMRSGLMADWEDFLKKASEAARLVTIESISLRPEATASVCRAYIENGMQQWPQPVKLYTIGPMFRRERPQKGRYRQFYQIDAEVLGGSDAPGIDAELIEMVMTFFERLELEGVELDINCIGDKKCRPKYVELLRAELWKIKDKLGPDSQRRIETNPLRVLDSKLEHEQSFIEKLPRIADHLCEECAENYRGVKKELELRGVKYRENWRLVRGLDYYSRTTFEITAKGLGSQNAVCGGGRYDGLIELLGGPPTRATGFAIGEDRLVLSLQESGKGLKAPGKGIYIVWIGERAHTAALSTAAELRNAGFRVELPPVEQKVGKALGQADKLGTNCAVILGDNEIASGEYTVKTLSTGTQEKVTKANLVGYLNSQFV